MNNYFKAPGNLEEKPNTGDFFHKPGDLENKSKVETSEEIKKYLSEISTGKKTEGLTIGGAKMFVSFDRLKEMVNEGYNIIKASYFEQMNMIEVTFDIPYKSKTR